MLVSAPESQLPAGEDSPVGVDGAPVGDEALRVGKGGGDDSEDGGRGGCLTGLGGRVGGALSATIAKERTMKNFMMLQTKTSFVEIRLKQEAQATDKGGHARAARETSFDLRVLQILS